MKITKTDNLLKLIKEISTSPISTNGVPCVFKADLEAILGMSRAQTYKIIKEYLAPASHRDAVFDEVVVGGVKMITLNPENPWG